LIVVITVLISFTPSFYFAHEKRKTVSYRGGIMEIRFTICAAVSKEKRMDKSLNAVFFSEY
jgi:hypothetical protein